MFYFVDILPFCSASAASLQHLFSCAQSYAHKTSGQVSVSHPCFGPRTPSIAMALACSSVPGFPCPSSAFVSRCLSRAGRVSRFSPVSGSDTSSQVAWVSSGQLVGFLPAYSPFIDPIFGAFSVRLNAPPDMFAIRCCDHRLEECGLAKRSDIGQSWRSFASRSFDLTEQRATRDASDTQTSPQCISCQAHILRTACPGSLALPSHFLPRSLPGIPSWVDLLQGPGFILKFISWESCPARYPLIGSNSKVMVCAASPIRVLSSHFNGLHTRCFHSGGSSGPTLCRPTSHRWGTWSVRCLHLARQAPDFDPCGCQRPVE